MIVVGVRHYGRKWPSEAAVSGALRQKGLRPISAFCFRLSTLVGKIVDKIATVRRRISALTHIVHDYVLLGYVNADLHYRPRFD
jgi:hypothetical protein